MRDRRDRAKLKNFAPIREQNVENDRQQNTKCSKPEQPVLGFVFGRMPAGGGPKSERKDGNGRNAEQTRRICFRPFRTRAWRGALGKLK